MQYANQYLGLCHEGPSSILNGLSRKEKEILAQHHVIQTISKGSLLFCEGDKPCGIICLLEGAIKIFKHGVGGRDQILQMLKPLDFTGFNTFFPEHSWHVSAKALTDSLVCVFEAGSFMKVLRKNADLSMKLFRVVSDNLSSSENRTLSLTQKHVRGRIAETLLMLGDIYGFEEDGRTLRITLSREDIASLSNMTTSNAIRTLSLLAEEGNIEVKGRKISLIEKHTLQHISQFG